MKINEAKLEKYLSEELIIEFNSEEECRKYFNIYDYQKFQTVEEMKAYQGKYGFGFNGKWYHINVDEALDVYEHFETELERANQSVSTKISLLKVKYKNFRSVWANEKDDRKVFCNIYDMLIEACEDMKNVTSNFIWVAFNRKYNEELEVLESILKRFTEERNQLKMENRICGILFEHGKDDFELWEGFGLSEEDESAIRQILQKYETEGCSLRGTRKEIAEETVN